MSHRQFESAAERGLTTPRAAGVAGIVFAVLFVVALDLLAEVVGVELDTQAVMDEPERLELDRGPGRPLPAAVRGIAFLWFIGVIRDRIGDREDRFFATVFLGSGLLFVAMLFAGGAVLGGLIAGNRFGHRGADRRARPSASPARSATRSCSSTPPRWRACSCSRRRRSSGAHAGLAGRTSAVSSIAVVLLLSVSFFEPIVLLLPAWVTAISVYVLVTGGRRPAGGTGR